MCQAVAKRIIKVSQNVGWVESNKGQEKIICPDLSLKAGDFVLVCGNIALKKISRQEAKELNKYAI